MATLQNLLPAVPEIFVLIMACVILMISVFAPRFKQLPYYCVQLTLIVTALLSWWTYSFLSNSMPVLVFHNTFVLDKMAMSLKLFIYLSVFFTFLYSRQYNDERRIPQNEFYVLGLLSTLGMMVLVSSHNLLTLFLGLELLSLPIYAMVALQRGKARCIEAAMKYFVFGALASGLLLYGMSMLFGATKSLDIARIAQVVAVTPMSENLIMVFALVLIVSSVAFKMGAAPFHMWVPDVYDGAPNTVTLFISGAPKIAAFALAIRLIVETMPSLHVQWSEILIVIAILSMAIGNIVAIVQSNIKRMLAYSSIAHMGYMLLGLACATSRGYAAAMFYIVSYSIMTLGAFGMIVLLSGGDFEASQISDFTGLNTRNPWLAFMMMIVMFSMAGIPPLVGFIAKVGVIEALIQVHLVWLAVVAVIFAIIGAYYYIRVIKVMYFEKPLEDHPPIQYASDLGVAITLNGLGVLLLGIFPGALFALCHVTF